MERIPRAIYTRELREEAVRLVTEGTEHTGGGAEVVGSVLDDMVMGEGKQRR